MLTSPHEVTRRALGLLSATKSPPQPHGATSHQARCAPARWPGRHSPRQPLSRTPARELILTDKPRQARTHAAHCLPCTPASALALEHAICHLPDAASTRAAQTRSHAHACGMTLVSRASPSTRAQSSPPAIPTCCQLCNERTHCTKHTAHEPRAAAHERVCDGRLARASAATHTLAEPAPSHTQRSPCERRRHTRSATRRTGFWPRATPARKNRPPCECTYKPGCPRRCRPAAPAPSPPRVEAPGHKAVGRS